VLVCGRLIGHGLPRRLVGIGVLLTAVVRPRGLRSCLRTGDRLSPEVDAVEVGDLGEDVLAEGIPGAGLVLVLSARRSRAAVDRARSVV
jgi:hypothetical protein